MLGKTTGIIRPKARDRSRYTRDGAWDRV